MNNINENIKMLYNEFVNIKDKGWIESKRKGPGGIGYTFESLINKPEENFPIPDFNGIEIKTYRKYTKRNIHLFSATPDGDYLFQIKRILYYLGYPDKEFNNIKVFNMNFNATSYKRIGLFKEGKIVVNREKNKVDFIARNINGKSFNINTSWSFKMLKNRLYLKLKYLATINTDVKLIDGIEYFNYHEINFYKLKNFESFIFLIENGYIEISFNIGVFKSGTKKGKIHDRGVSFRINEKYINMLFNKIDIHNLTQEDKKNNQL